MRPYIFILTLFSCSACKFSEKSILGKYKSDYPKSELLLESNHKFTFSRTDGNLALLYNENFFVTKGIWIKTANNRIILNSTPDSSQKIHYKIREDIAREANTSYFTFFDKNGDTINISLYYHNNQMSGKIHGEQSYIKANIVNGDSLNFHFNGYRMWHFVKSNNCNCDYAITLFPEYPISFFNQTEFLIKHNRLIELKKNAKFKKTKSGM